MKSKPQEGGANSGPGVDRRQFLKVAGLSPLVAESIGSATPAPEAGTSPPPAAKPGTLYLADLKRCQPASSLAKTWKHGTWRLLDYTTDTLSGQLLLAGHDSQAPEVTYPVNRSGWHEIYIGIYRKPFTQAKQVQMRLTSDRAFTKLTGREGEKDHQEHWIDEIFWKATDLSGQGVVFKQITDPVAAHAWVAFIKLVPLSAQEVQALQADRRSSDTKRLFVHNDGGVIDRSGTGQEVINALEPLRNTDVSRIYWEGGTGDTAKRFSKIATDHSMELRQPPEGGPFFSSAYGRYWAEGWMAYYKNGVDPFRVAAEYCREIGLEFHAGFRPGGFIYPPYSDELPGKDFYKNNPDLVCMTRDGKPIPRISYAYPKTRRYVIALFREMATEYPIDGVGVFYNRRPPLLAYEAPLVEGFQAKYGEDPRKISESDPRWLRYRAGFLTQFMKELRAELDRVAEEQKRDRRLEITAIVSRGPENLPHGMDLHTWVREDLVDTVIPYSSAVRLGAYEPTWEDPEDVEWFVSLVKGSKCRLALNFLPRDLTAEEYYRKTHKLYKAGVENFFFWDGTERVRKVLRLGHREEVDAWVAAGQPPRLPSAVRVWSLAGWDLHLETPG